MSAGVLPSALHLRRQTIELTDDVEILEQPAHHSPHPTRILDEIVLFIDCDVCQRSSARERVIANCENKRTAVIRSLMASAD